MLPAGEVHLEMCIKDLKERFARVELQVSAPLVAFRESAFYPAEAAEVAFKPAKVWASSSCTLPNPCLIISGVTVGLAALHGAMGWTLEV